MRYIIFGDLMFSFVLMDIYDPASLIFKLSRAEYLKGIDLRSEINIIFECDIDNYKLIHQKLIMELTSVGLIVRNQVKFEKLGISTAYMTFLIPEVCIKIKRGFGTSNTPFKLLAIGKSCDQGTDELLKEAHFENTMWCVASFRNI